MTSRRTRPRARFGVPSLAVAAVTALLAGCASSADAGADGEEPTAAAEAEELEEPQPRLVATYDGGLLTLDAETLEVVDDTALEGFIRVNPAGDGRHVFVSVPAGFQLFDAGVWTEPHGDHGHSYAGEPLLTDTVYEGDTAGHVVVHGEKTVLFSDGDGKIQILETAALLEGAPDPEVLHTEEAHHGVAVELESGELLYTIGNEEERSGALVLDENGEEVDRNEDCPGVHGEAAAKDDVITVGCQTGILVYKDGSFTKVDAPDDYGRIGNQAGSEESAVVLGDYKVDEDAELERPERISLTDTESGELTLVDLGTSYSFRSLGRGPAGEGLVLGTDGSLHVIDVEAGEVTDSIPVVEEWEEPMDWQLARPTLFVQDGLAYVSEPASSELHVVDLASGEVVRSAELPHATNELTGVTG